MSAATPPIVITGTVETGREYVQFWTDTRKVAGVVGAHCMAEINTPGSTGGFPLLHLNCECPAEWVDLVLHAFRAFRTPGAVVQQTHTVTWTFGKPTFTPIAPAEETADVALFDDEVPA